MSNSAYACGRLRLLLLRCCHVKQSRLITRRSAQSDCAGVAAASVCLRTAMPFWAGDGSSCCCVKQSRHAQICTQAIRALLDTSWQEMRVAQAKLLILNDLAAQARDPEALSQSVVVVLLVIGEWPQVLLAHKDEGRLTQTQRIHEQSIHQLQPGRTLHVGSGFLRAVHRAQLAPLQCVLAQVFSQHLSSSCRLPTCAQVSWAT